MVIQKVKQYLGYIVYICIVKHLPTVHTQCRHVKMVMHAVITITQEDNTLDGPVLGTGSHRHWTAREGLSDVACHGHYG